MATNQYIIELREDDKYTKKGEQNGSYEVILDRPLLLQENDELSLKGAFIDNEAVSSGRIKLPIEPLTDNECHIRISFVKYYFDGGTSLRNPDGSPNQQDIIYTPPKLDSPANLNVPRLGSSAYPDGHHYFLANTVQGDAAYNIKRMLSFTFKQVQDYVPAQGMNAGQPNLFKIAIAYTDHTNNPQRIAFDLPINNISRPDIPNGYDYYGKNPGQFTIDKDFPGVLFTQNSLPFMFRDDHPIQIDGTYIYNDPSTVTNYPARSAVHWMELYGLTLDSFKSELVPSDHFTLTPRVETTTVILDATNDYTPETLATEITRKLTAVHEKILIESQLSFLDNPLISTTDELRHIGMTAPSAIPDNLPDANADPFFCGENGDRLLTFGGCKQADPADGGATPATNNNYLMGTPQFAIQFQETPGAEGYFQITAIHGSRFVSNPQSNAVGQEVVNLVDNGFPTQREFNKHSKFIANKNIGIALVDLYPQQLWFDIMSFEPSIITHFPTDRSFSDDQFTYQTFRALNAVKKNITIEDGVSVTGQVKSIDVAQQKGTSFDRLPTDFRNEIIQPLPIPITPKKAVEVNASLRDEGYYQIEINANGLRTNKYGGTQYNSKIMGLVSKFYQQNAYTSALDGEGGFTYIHKGTPIQLSKFGVRILNPDGSPAEGLAPYTSIFLQVLSNINY